MKAMKVPSPYAQVKIKAISKILDKSWSEAQGKKELELGAITQDESLKVKLFIKNLTSFLKIEGLEVKDVANLLTRLEEAGLIWDYEYLEREDDEDRGDYFKESYFSFAFPENYPELVEKYLHSLTDPEQIKIPESSRPSRRPSEGLDFLFSIILLPVGTLWLIVKGLFSFIIKTIAAIVQATYKHLIWVLGLIIAIIIVLTLIYPIVPQPIGELMLRLLAGSR